MSGRSPTPLLRRRARRPTALPLLIGLAALFTLTAAAPGLRAQPIDSATRSSARQLGVEATELFDRGDFAGALDKFQRADALVHLPTIQVREARCLDKLGRLIEAAERYLAVTRMELPADALPVHREALVDAERELGALRERIPSLVIEVIAGPDAEITIDGARVPPALWGQRRAVDPGHHHLALRWGEIQVTRDLDVRERELLPVKLEASRPAAPPPAPPIAPPLAAPPLVAPPPPSAPPHVDVPPRPGAVPPLALGPSPGEAPTPGLGQRVAGGIALGLGGAGLLVGAITGGLVLSQRGDLESRCGPALACRPPDWADADAYNRLRMISTSTFVAGGLLAAAGAVLVFTAPRPRPPTGVALRPWIGAGSAGVQGTFP